MRGFLTPFYFEATTDQSEYGRFYARDVFYKKTNKQTNKQLLALQYMNKSAGS